MKLLVEESLAWAPGWAPITDAKDAPVIVDAAYIAATLQPCYETHWGAIHLLEGPMYFHGTLPPGYPYFGVDFCFDEVPRFDAMVLDQPRIDPFVHVS